MKRKNEKVPGFDEIIFENRNRKYGAFDLRKNYKSATSFSILGGVALFAGLTASMTITTEEVPVSPPILDTVTIVIFNPVNQKIDLPPEPKLPPELTKAIQNVQPVVTTDTNQVTAFIPITDDLLRTTKNGSIDTNGIVGPVDNPDPVIPPDKEPPIWVEEMPTFPGGDAALLQYINENIIYPSEAQDINLQGRVVLRFVVNTDGSVDRIEVIKSIDPLLDNEAIRVVRTLPRFKPGKQNGVPVRVWFTIPVFFKLQNN